MSPQRPRGHAVRCVGRLPVLAWGGGVPLLLHSPHPAAWGWWVGWLVARMQAPGAGGGGGSPYESLEYWRAPGVRWLANRARRAVCLGVHGMQAPFGWPWCPLLQQCLTPLCVGAHVGQGGVPMPLTDPGLGQRLWWALLTLVYGLAPETPVISPDIWMA